MNVEPNTIWDTVNQISGADLAMIVTMFFFFATLLIIMITVTVSKTVYRMQKNRLEAALKRELVDRGFSATEIVEIIAASASPGAVLPTKRGRETPKEIEHAYAK